MADVLGREIEVPDIANPTAVGAAIHGAVAGGVVKSFAEGAARFGARRFDRFKPDLAAVEVYASLYQQYRQLAADDQLRWSMRALGTAGGFPNGSSEVPRCTSHPASPEREVSQANP